MLGKNHAKLFYDIMNKLFQTFQSSYSLHKPPHPYCFTLPSSHEFCGQIFENIFFSLDLLVQKLFFDKNHWFQLLSTKNDWIVSLFLISITLHSLSVNHSIMSSVGEEALAFDENFIATPHQVTLREKILFLGVLSVFLFFFFSFLLFELLRPLWAGLHENQSELKPISNLKPLWNVVLFTWQFTWQLAKQ